MEGQFFDFAMAGTFTGCVLITTVITQFIKRFIPVDADGKYKFPIELLSFIIAVGLMIGASFAFGTFGWESAILALINGVTVSLAANGGYDNTSKVITNVKKK